MVFQIADWGCYIIHFYIFGYQKCSRAQSDVRECGDIKAELLWAPVAHFYNPNYSGGRDQEDCGSKPAWANSSQEPISKKIHHKKRAGGVAQGVGPEFKIQ
jgi:hypothetical protein